MDSFNLGDSIEKIIVTDDVLKNLPSFQKILILYR